MKFVPCRDHCYIRYGKQYTKECDTTCDYARVCLENEQKDEIIEFLLDMLEEEHMGMRSVAVKEAKSKFNIEL